MGGPNGAVDFDRASELLRRRASPPRHHLQEHRPRTAAEPLLLGTGSRYDGSRLSEGRRSLGDADATARRIKVGLAGRDGHTKLSPPDNLCSGQTPAPGPNCRAGDPYRLTDDYWVDLTPALPLGLTEDLLRQVYIRPSAWTENLTPVHSFIHNMENRDLTAEQKSSRTRTRIGPSR